MWAAVRAVLWAAVFSFVRPHVASAATAHVQYISSSSVYLDAGLGAGLVEGASVRVERDGELVAELVVEFVAQNSAACKVVTSASSLRAGDVCTFTAAQLPAPAPAPSVGTAVRWRPADFGGLIALSYRRTGDLDRTFTNPGLRIDLLWDGTERRQLELRLRGDYPRFDTGPPTADVIESSPGPRLYEAELRYRGPAEGLEFAAGRFIPRHLEQMGYVDGGALAVRPGPALQLGVVGGQGAILGSSGFERSGWKLGGFLEIRDPGGGGDAGRAGASRTGSAGSAGAAGRAAASRAGGAGHSGARRWRALVGGAHLQDADVVRRQFLLVRADERLGRRVRAWEQVEVDVNPPWKQELGEDRLELTTVAVGTQVEWHRRVDVGLGFDSRRDLLLPEQRPASAAELRLGRTQGLHGAVHLRVTRAVGLRLGTDVRTLSDGTRTTLAGDASLYGPIPGVPQLSGLAHANLYDAAPGRGQLLDATLSYSIRFLRFDVAGGTHLVRDLPAADGFHDKRTNWLRLGGGLEAPWGFWLDASGEWRSESGGTEFHLEVRERF